MNQYSRPIDDIDYEIGGIEIAMEVLQKRWAALQNQRSHALKKIIGEADGPPPVLPELKDRDVNSAGKNKLNPNPQSP